MRKNLLNGVPSALLYATFFKMCASRLRKAESQIEELESKIQEAIEEVRTRWALADAKNGEGRPAKEVLEEVRTILDGSCLMGWISVKDRLLEKDSSVLIAGHGRYVTIADWYKGSGWSVDREGLFGSKDITHWMPLPEPPSEKPTALNQRQKSEDEQ